MRGPDLALRRKLAAFCRREAVKARNQVHKGDGGYQEALAALWDKHARHWEEKVRQGERLVALAEKYQSNEATGCQEVK